MSAFLTCLCRNLMFTGLYLSWDAFAPKSRKVNLIKCLIFRALKICSDTKIKSEFEPIKNLFLCNGYPEKVIANTLNLTVSKFRNDNRPFGSSKCLVYVRLLWIGSASQLIADKVTSVACYYKEVKIWTFFTLRATFCSIHKDVLSIFQQCNLIYKFQCCCDATYIGCTLQYFELRVRQHVPHKEFVIVQHPGIYKC